MSNSTDPRDWSDQEVVDELLERESGLTDWETKFADSIARWLYVEGNLTSSQRRKALEIIDG